MGDYVTNVKQVCQHCGNFVFVNRVGYCKDCWAKRARRVTNQAKEIVIKKYGGKCWCCGESRHEFLCLDHTDGSTWRERGRVSGSQLYRELAKLPVQDDIQLSCYNCNNVRQIYGACPHWKDRRGLGKLNKSTTERSIW
jgi:hypothetical protein